VRGATLYVTLEPCCHHGKTPPCSEAVIESGARRVVVAARDPFPQVAGGGIAKLEAAGLTVEVGLLADEARRVLAPYLKLVEAGRPWIIAKWAMTLDGKIATATGDSRWISSNESRAVVHQLRGRVDAVMIGGRTAKLDDPLLTGRPAGPRVATRLVVDTHASLSLESQLVRTARDAPVLLAVGEEAPADRCRALSDLGVEIYRCAGATHNERLGALLNELGRRRMTNVLVEGGGELLGAWRDLDEIDEVHVFLAPKIVGGADAPSPLAGRGVKKIADAARFETQRIEACGPDVYFIGRTMSGKLKIEN
jgi:diaminohydroxyphosphoribosylaminopyrimidine deaminase/5-amino-6-(5-phosphoribosylamino)uracil reductase